MNSACFLLILILKLCQCENVFSSFRLGKNHQVREELVVKNVTLYENFQLNYTVSKWTSLCNRKKCFLAGLMSQSIVVTDIESNEKNLLEKSHIIEMDSSPFDIQLFEHWNATLRKSEVILVVASNKIDFFQLSANNPKKLWTWQLDKNILHINVFQIEYKTHLLAVNSHKNRFSADLYEFELENVPNFWLRQHIPLVNSTKSSALLVSGPDHFLAIPQTYLNSLLIYKLTNNHFESYKNITSPKISEVISFKFGHKSFLAFNGLEASIFQFKQSELIEEGLDNGNLDGVHYWLPIPFNSEREDTILIAQRVLHHDLHHSFVIELITYDGIKFEEHEDVPCSYFGEIFSGLTCLPGEDSENGLIGAAVLVMDDFLGVLVPRKKFSELFSIEAQIQKNSNPAIKEINELKKRQRYLDNLMQEQDKELKKLNDKLQLSSSEVDTDENFSNLKNKIDKIEMEINETLEKLNNTSTHFEKIIFSENVNILEAVFAENLQTNQINNQTTETFFEDIVMKNNMSVINSQKTFVNLEIENVNTEIVNQINASNLIFSDEPFPEITGNITIEKPVKVMNDINAENINGIVFQNEVVEFSKNITNPLEFENLEIVSELTVEKMNNMPLSKRSIPEFINFANNNDVELEELYIPHDLVVENVNGENFNSLLKQISMKNIETYIPGQIQVQGNIEVLQDAEIQFVNNLNFPIDYIFKNEIHPSITGKKIFNNSVITNEIHCDKINNINPEKMITLSTYQNITGTITFNRTEVTENFDILGTVSGEHPEKFLENPNITETDLVKANVLFTELEVEGTIIIEENLNGQNYSQILEDIVYKTEKEPIINAIKTFSEGLSVFNNLHIESNTINNIDLQDIVTKNTEQILNISLLNGNVNFGDIEIRNGLYNFVNITKLDQEVVKLTGDQYISATLIFNGELNADELKIGNLSGLGGDKIDMVKKNRELNESVSLDSVEAENVVVQGHLEGKINGFDVKEFSERRLSVLEDQTIDMPITINKSLIENFSLTGSLNEITLEELKESSFNNKIKESLLRGQIKVENLHADNLTIGKINDIPAMAFGDLLWKNQSCFNITELNFEDNVFFNTIEIEKLSRVDFASLVDSIIFKNNSNPVLTGNIYFANGITVKKLIETEKLNNIPIDDILTKFGKQEIKSPIEIHGNVDFLQGINISHTVNNISIDEFLKNYQRERDHYKITGDVIFSRLAHINNLEIKEFANEKPLKAHLDSIVYKKGDFNLSQDITFANKVNIQGNVRVLNEINNVNLPKFVSNMVMITKDETIHSSVQFSAPITVKNRLTFEDALETHTLNGIQPETWLDEAVFINKGFLPGHFIFNNTEIFGNLRTNFINSINASSLIPLRSKQSLPELNFDEITSFNDIPVGNSTNSLNFTEEFANTVLLNTNEIIETDLEFTGNVFAEKNIELNGLLGTKQLDKVVTTNSDQTLSAVYDFKAKVTLEEDLFVENGLINGINLQNWKDDRVKTDGEMENIKMDWLINNDLVFENDISGNGLINGRNMDDFKNELEEKRYYKYNLEKDAIETYRNICKDFTFIHNRLKKQIFRFNYFEMMEQLEFKQPIHHIHHYKFNKNYYVLINENRECHSHLFKFADRKLTWIKKILMGQIEQMIEIYQDKFRNLMFLVTRHSNGCEITGTNLWQVVEDNIIHVLNVEKQDLLQDSLIPATFYGLSRRTVTEFRLKLENDINLQKYRKWELNYDNLAFVPRGMKTGLAMRTDYKMIRLNTEVINNDDDFEDEQNYNTEIVINGNFTEEPNIYLPSHQNGDFAVLSVGIRRSKRRLLAVASHEETSVEGSVDFIKIYEDIIKGKVFHKIPTHDPSALTSIEFNNGETLLAFFENENTLQMYAYKGIEGFKHKLTVRINGTDLFTMALPLAYNGDERTILGVIDGKKVTFLQAVMLGNQINENLQCVL